jgi:uncharacterized protein (TIRG00374 family)
VDAGRLPAPEAGPPPPARGGAARRGSLALKAAVSAALILFLARRVDWEQLRAALTALPWHAPVAALAAVLAGLLLWPLRLQRLLRVQSVEVGYGTLVRLTFVGLFLGNVLPSSMGGDAVKLGMLLRHRPGRRTRITLSVVADRLANVLATFLLLGAVSVVPGLLSAGLDVAGGALRIVWIGMAVGAAAFALGFRWLRAHLARGHATHPAGQGWRARLLHLAHGVVAAVSNWTSAPGTLVFALGLSVASTLVFIGAGRILAAGVGVAVRPQDWIAVQCLLAVIGILPIALNGLGVQEAGVVFLLGRLGVAPGPALAYALLNRLLFLAASLPGAVGWLGRERERPAA